MRGVAASHSVQAYVGLGANLDDPASHVRSAIDAIDALSHTRVVARSSLYRSAPVGYLDQPDFVNAVVAVDTALSPQVLLRSLLEIEHSHGRVRTFRNAPRTLDLDLLLYGDQAIDEHGLILPHPRMHERAFVLLPLAEIAPKLWVPGLGSVAELLGAIAVSGIEKLVP